MSFIEVEQGRSYYCEVTIERPIVGSETETKQVTIGGTFKIDGGDN